MSIPIVRCDQPILLTYKVLHRSDEDPKSLATSVEGTKSLSNLLVAVIVVEVEIPRSTSPVNEEIPDTLNRSKTVTPTPVLKEATV